MGGTGGHGEPSLWPEHGFPSALPHPPPASVFGENNSQGDTSLVINLLSNKPVSTHVL